MLEAAKEGRLRLVASDGFNETVVEVGPIIVVPSAPQLEILTPEQGTTFPHTTPIQLQAAAFGNDRMAVSGDQLEWSVDGKVVGSGASVEVHGLETGAHTARIVARDGKLSSEREVKFMIDKQTTAMPSEPVTPAEK